MDLQKLKHLWDRYPKWPTFFSSLFFAPVPMIYMALRHSRDGNTGNVILLAIGSLFCWTLATGYFANATRQVPNAEWWSNYLQGVSTEMAGAIVTAVVLGFVIGFSEEQALKNEELERLLETVRYGSQVEAQEAISQLRQEGYATDGTLIGIDFANANIPDTYLAKANLQEAKLWRADLQETVLKDANLQEADLTYANLQEADLWGANLQDADLRGANMQGAYLIEAKLVGAYLDYTDLVEGYLLKSNLWGAEVTYANLQRAKLQESNLQEANLVGTDLRGADLSYANLQEANLVGTDLRGADLSYANLRNASLAQAKFDGTTTFEFTILPDGTLSFRDLDMMKYTEPTYPEFWEPAWVKEERENREGRDE